MSMAKIEHVVLLMLENRSFDSMLGWTYEQDTPSLNIPDTAPNDRFRGLHSINLAGFTNTATTPKGPLSVAPTRGADGYTVPSIAPGEEFENVNTQIFQKASPQPTDLPTMKGYLADFVAVMGHLAPDADLSNAKMVLESYTPSQLPVLNQLAKHYAVSDGWFASVPSQTNPNRAFTMCGTSDGLVNNGDLEIFPDNKEAKALEDLLHMAIGDDRFDEKTIFNALNDLNADWNVFWQTSYLPQKISGLLTVAPFLAAAIAAAISGGLLAAVLALIAALRSHAAYLQSLTSGGLESCYTWRLFPQIHNIPNAAQRFQGIDEFHRLARAGQLPRFSYVEPYWTIAQTSVDAGLKRLVTAMGNDYHPPCNMITSEDFLSSVYSSLIANRDAWAKTLLIITFDESVGSFDHVLPSPPAVPPWGPTGKAKYPNKYGFNFDRFGPRVPAILVSPYVQKQTVFRSTTAVPYDHTSIIKTTLGWLGAPNSAGDFGQRTVAAPAFDNVLTLDTARTDEHDLDFLNVGRAIGDIVQYGDPFFLRNQNDQYISSSQIASKKGKLPAAILPVAVDLNIAAYFPTLDGAERVPLTFLNAAPDLPPNIPDGAQTFLVSKEPALVADNFLGAWNDSGDCYYYNGYLDGPHKQQQTWIIENVTNKGQPLRFGDQIHLVNVFFPGQRLTRDDSWFTLRDWVKRSADGDYWTLEPVAARVPPPPPPARPWNLSTLDGASPLILTVNDGGDGSLAGSLTCGGVAYSVSGAWAASGAVPGRNASAFCLSGGTSDPGPTMLAAAGIMTGSGQQPTQVTLQVTVSSSADGGLRTFSGVLVPI
jgi:phospholipase C